MCDTLCLELGTPALPISKPRTSSSALLLVEQVTHSSRVSLSASSRCAIGLRAAVSSSASGLVICGRGLASMRAYFFQLNNVAGEVPVSAAITATDSPPTMR